MVIFFRCDIVDLLHVVRINGSAKLNEHRISKPVLVYYTKIRGLPLHRLRQH